MSTNIDQLVQDMICSYHFSLYSTNKRSNLHDFRDLKVSYYQIIYDFDRRFK